MTCRTPPPANATLYFEVKGTEVVIDPATCNQVLETTLIPITAVLTETGNRNQQEEQLGQNTTFRQLRGYLYEEPPMKQPYRGRVKCEIDCQKGIFHFHERITPYRQTIVKDIGIPVQGSFQTEGGGR
jgi:hypothetical protein